MRRYAKLALVALALGSCVLVYRGPGRPFIRGHVGDVGATMLVYALLGMVLRFRPPWLAVATMAIATAIEVGQLFWSGTGMAGELVVGSTFDGWDFVAYLVGTVIALVWDVSYRRRRGLNPVLGSIPYQAHCRLPSAAAISSPIKHARNTSNGEDKFDT